MSFDFQFMMYEFINYFTFIWLAACKNSNVILEYVDNLGLLWKFEKWRNLDRLKSPRLLGHCSKALYLLGWHRLSDRGELEADADGCLPSQGHSRGAAVVAIQYLSIYRDPNLEHPQHQNDNMHSERGRSPIHERGHSLPPTLPTHNAIKGRAKMS